MLSSKSNLSNSSSNKSTPATPRVSKIGRLGSAKVDPDSPSPQQNLRPSVQRSPRSVNSKPTLDRRSSKIITPPDKQPRAMNGSELQEQLTVVQEGLKKVKEKLVSEEKEKALVLEELKEAKKAVEAANENLEDALLSKKMAEESSELDKFRADELEQSAIEASRKREEEWMIELGNVKNQHAVDVAALLSATHELQRVKQDLVMTTEAKNTALGHADDAMKIAEINAEKVEVLSGEISRLKFLLDSELKIHSKKMAEMIKKFDSEAEILKLELCKSKAAEEKLVDAEASIEGLQVQVLNSKIAESDAFILVHEWKKKVELLAFQLEEVSQSEKEVKCSLDSVMKQLEERKVVRNDAKSEITSLKGKLVVLELDVARHKQDFQESCQRIDLAKKEVFDMEKAAEVLKSEIQKAEDVKAHAINNEKIAYLNVEILTQENNKLAVELKITKEESKKAKEAMEGLASALLEVSTETSNTQEHLLIKQGLLDSASAEAEALKSTFKNAQDKYELILDEAKYEIICLKKAIEKSETKAKDLKVEWDLKEHSLISVIQKSEEEIASIKLQKDEALETLDIQKDEAKVAEEMASKLMDKLRRAETETVFAKKSMEEVMAEALNLKERLLDKENELQNITQENDELNIRDSASLEKIKELSILLTELKSRKIIENGDARGNGENEKVCNCHNEYDLLSLASEARQDRVNETKTEEPEPPKKADEVLKKDAGLVEIDNANGNTKENHYDHGNTKEDELCEGGETIDKQLSSEREDDTESVVNDHVNVENAKNGNKTSPNKQQQQQQHKKKKPLFHNFGSILKKKSNIK